MVILKIVPCIYTSPSVRCGSKLIELIQIWSHLQHKHIHKFFYGNEDALPESNHLLSMHWNFLHSLRYPRGLNIDGNLDLNMYFLVTMKTLQVHNLYKGINVHLQNNVDISTQQLGLDRPPYSHILITK